MIFKKRISDKSFRVIFFLLSLGFVCDLYALYLLYQHKVNYLTYNLFILVEGVFIGIFFYQILDAKLIKRILLVTGIGFTIYSLYKFFSIGDQVYLNSCLTIENISILAFAVYYYYEQIIKINTTFIFNQPRFWIVTAYLISIAGTFFLSLYLPTFNNEDQEKYYVLNYIFVILRTILISFAMLMKTEGTTTRKNNLKVSTSLTE